jgi:hypothetical protein
MYSALLLTVGEDVSSIEYTLRSCMFPPATNLDFSFGSGKDFSF